MTAVAVINSDVDFTSPIEARIKGEIKLDHSKNAEEAIFLKTCNSSF